MMNRQRHLLAAVAGLVALVCNATLTIGAEQTLNGHTFTLPNGFHIELAAGPPLVDRPITADLDEDGNLYISDSSGSNDKIDKQLAEKPHRVLRLEDSDKDGTYDRRTIFADKLMFPEGTMWYDGSLYVSAPPSIWKLTDTDRDGIADQRLEWFQGRTLTGCANDLHGPYLGPDGWIYWCKGAFAEQTYERPGRKPLVTKASHIFRCRPDGTGIESVMTGGMDNPVDVIFTPGGERIFTTTFLQLPAAGRRDGLIHAIYGGVYGKVHDVIEKHPRTGREVMPVLTHLGAAAPCGLTRYESSDFGQEYRDNVFAALFNMQKITRHVLEPNGASFVSSDSDFVVSSNRDFHPTDVLDAADGTLLIVDTGGWYKLCCPTSQLWKPDILGAVYRVKRTSDSPRNDPRGLTLNWSTPTTGHLVKRLDDERIAVRRRAVQLLGKMGPDALPEIAIAAWTGSTPELRRNAVWAATRIDDPAARDVVRGALADSDPLVRQCAIHSVSIWRDKSSLLSLIVCLRDAGRPGLEAVARTAAEALGRLGESAAIPALLEASGSPADRALEHSITFALTEINDAAATQGGLTSSNTFTQRAAMIALDQMESPKLDVADILPHLTSSDTALRDAAHWIGGRHPEWGAALAGFLRDRLMATDLSDIERVELAQQLADFSKTAAIQQLLSECAADPDAPSHTRLTALKAMARSGLKELPDIWLDSLIRVMAGPTETLVSPAVAVARSIPAAKARTIALNAALSTVTLNPQVSSTLRLEAAAAIVGGLPKVSLEMFEFLLLNLDSNQPVAIRITAADVISKSALSAEQLGKLAQLMRDVGPLEADRLLLAFERTTDERIGQQLVAALKESSVLTSLRLDTLRQCLSKFGEAVAPQAEELYSRLNVDAAQQRTRIEGMLKTLKDGDVRRGQAVFNSPKAACAACHAIGYLGGKTGPDLTHIAQIRQERDLLEAIVYPSASFVRSYEPIAITTQNGRVLNGLLTKEAPDELTITVSATETVRVPREDIDELRPSTVSIMPAGMDQQLSPQQMADLLAFLKACK